MAEADNTNPFAEIQMLLGIYRVPTMAEADNTNPFAKIQMLLGTDRVPTMAEADKKRPFFYNLDQMKVGKDNFQRWQRQLGLGTYLLLLFSFAWKRT